MDKLITASKAIDIVADCCCKDCKKVIKGKCPEDCAILSAKITLFEANADAVLVAVEARLI